MKKEGTKESKVLKKKKRNEVHGGPRERLYGARKLFEKGTRCSEGILGLPVGAIYGNRLRECRTKPHNRSFVLVIDDSAGRADGERAGLPGAPSRC